MRLCQCGHVYDIEMCAHNDVIYMRGKCLPTMRSKPPFYFLFIMVDIKAMRPTGGNCFCAAGASQSCVHISAMLLTVAEVTATACTSIRCAWSKPSGAKAPAVLASELDFGIASSEGHFPYTGLKPPASTLLDSLAAAGSRPAVMDFFEGEKEREASSKTIDQNLSNNYDPFSKLAAICSLQEPTVDDLFDALCMSSEKAELLQLKTIGQHDNTLWMDVRQWRITASNFGRVCNRNFRVLYPPSLNKIILGD